MDTEQDAGNGAGSRGLGDDGQLRGGAAGGGEREFGVRGAVERGPAELSDEGEPVRDVPHASLEDGEPARSTDELPSSAAGGPTEA